jgi:hypothetical protein
MNSVVGVIVLTRTVKGIFTVASGEGGKNGRSDKDRN